MSALKIGYSDGSGPEIITKDDEPFCAILWGCGCCKPDRGRAELIVRAVSNHDRLVSALEAAIVEINEAADKMHVLGCNHPGGGVRGVRVLDEDKALMGELSARFRNARDRARAVLAVAKGEPA